MIYTEHFLILFAGFNFNDLMVKNRHIIVTITIIF